jgi:signal transduction histidine kinase
VSPYSGYAGLHDYNRAIRDIATSADWQSAALSRQLGRVVEVAARIMGVGRVSVWFLEDGSQLLVCACQYDSRHGLIEAGQRLQASRYPAYFEALAQHRTLAVDDAQHDPLTAEMRHDYLAPMGVRSLLDAPIRDLGEVVGVICHEHAGEVRHWRDEDRAFAGSMADFIAMALAQQRIRQVEASRERLARIIEATPDVVVVIAVSGLLIQMNRAGRRLLDLADDTDISQLRARDFLGAHTISLLDGEILPALHDIGYWRGETIVRENTADEIPVSIVALAHRDASDTLEYFSVTLRDLTSQKAIQRQIEQMNVELEARVRARTEELELANRNLESFAYSVSHDLKAPLRGVEGYSRLLLNEYRDALPAEATEYVDLIVAASGRMERMIEDILAFSRAQMRVLIPARIAALTLVQEVLREFDAGLRGEAVLTLTIAAADLGCDREGVTQILRNFLSNAFRFSAAQMPPRIVVEGSITATGYRFMVGDNGIGFDMREHDRVFEIFQRLNADVRYPGSGVGLALAARAAERLGGRVWAESAAGAGARFYFEWNFRLQGVDDENALR